MRWRSLLACVALLLAREARADGAFPDELQLFAPADAGLVLTTTFGLLTAPADGGDWGYLCEAAISGSSVTRMYGRGPAGALYALTGSRVLRSQDQGCSWGSLDLSPATTVEDLWADPVDAARVYAIGYLSPGAELLASDDGAASFGPAVYQAPSGNLTSVESAASRKERVYLARYKDGAQPGSSLLRSDDRGQTWTELDHPELGDVRLFIAAVDPRDPDTLYLRANSIHGDSLLISTDAGQTLSAAFSTTEFLSAFAVAGDGALYAGTRSGKLWVRASGAAAFAQGTGPHLRCLAERGGRLYACGDATLDGFLLGASDDGAKTFAPVLGPGQAVEIAACDAPRALCCGLLAPPLEVNVCQTESVDAGSAPAPDAGPTPAPAPRPHGCGCTSGPDALGLAALLLAWRRRTSTR